MATLLILAALILIVVLTQALLLWLGGKALRLPQANFRRALAVVAAVTFIYVLLGIAACSLLGSDGMTPLFLEVCAALVLALWWALIFGFLARHYVAATVLTLGIILLSAGLALGLAFVTKAGGIGLYVLPSNSMLPTLAGPHHHGKSPLTGDTILVPHNATDVEPARGPRLGVQSTTRRLSVTRGWGPEVMPPDRILALDYLEPRRLDIVVYYPPPEPEHEFAAPRPIGTKFVSRLIGLPGEEIAIRQGVVFIDGNKLELPEELANLLYYQPGFGPAEPVLEEIKPRRLGQGEYFVLSDFSARATDSRHFGPLRDENLAGVVTAIYWPPERWRIFR